jgi:hypothetical protein
MAATNCTICFQNIPAGERVEILLKNPACKTIIGKYRWHHCTYCFPCLQASRKLLWRHFISLLVESDRVCAANMLASMKYYDFPLRLTDNMRIDGTPIYALYYHRDGCMHSSRLETGMSEMGLEMFREKVKYAKTVIENHILQTMPGIQNLEDKNKINKTNKNSIDVVDMVLGGLFRDLHV